MSISVSLILFFILYKQKNPQILLLNYYNSNTFVNIRVKSKYLKGSLLLCLFVGG